MCWNFMIINKQLVEKLNKLEEKVATLEHDLNFTTDELTNYLRKEKEVEILSKRYFKYRLLIGGRLVQVGRKRSDITLLDMDIIKYCRYHEWKLYLPYEKKPQIFEVGVDDYIEKNLDMMDYFDGIKDNHLKIMGGMAAANDIDLDISYVNL